MTSSIKPKGQVRRAVAARRQADDDAALGRRVHVDVIGVIAGLRDELEIGEFSQQGGGKFVRSRTGMIAWLPLSASTTSVFMGKLFGENLHVGFLTQPRDRFGGRNGMLVVVEDGDFHG